MPSPPPYRLERKHSDLEKIDEKDDEHVDIIFSGFETGDYSNYSSPLSSRPGSPDSSDPLLSQPTTPFSFGGASPFFTSPKLPRHLRRQARSNRTIYLAIAVLGLIAFGWRQQDRVVVQKVTEKVQSVATRAREERCRYMPWLATCPDPFRDLHFRQDAGELVYPATSTSAEADSTAIPPQAHPIHHLIREAESAWHAKVSRQSRTLEEAVAEYRRRYNQAPPRGFDLWYRFAVEHNVQLVDEYDSIYERMLPYAALRPEVLKKRSAMLQNVDRDEDEEEFWLHKESITLKIREKGTKVTAEGPMRNVNNRADQLLALLDGISQYLPDLNFTITGHDTPFIAISGEHKQMHIEAAKAGGYIDDFKTHINNWDLDGWTHMCPPDSAIRKLGHLEDRLDWTAPEKTSFIGIDHVAAMDICGHPENQAIHSRTSWPGPRPGLLLPMFSFSTTSLNADLLLPTLEQYERAVGPDPAFRDKKHDKAVWRGSTTGSDLTQAHARKYSQRVRLARLPRSTGQMTMPYAPNDRPGAPEPVEKLTGAAHDFADEYLDVKFQGYPQQCGDEAACAKFEREFEWDGYMSEEEQNQYKYVIDVDGNGWSGRFHRLMASNSLVLKSTIFPEWYADRIQPWVHYVPLKTDYTDLFPIMSFFKGSPYDGRGAHEDIAEKIAMAGKTWTEENWRWEDMQAYLLRLLLEYARVMGRDWSYDNMDYIPRPAAAEGALHVQ
ncbi:hypothetical protein JCM10207_003377 [Rhodosporidiobolus poonsookiae]